MKRISIFLDIDNLANILSMDQTNSDIRGMIHVLSKESHMIFCEDESVAIENAFFEQISKQLASGDYLFSFKSSEHEFLNPPFKTNLSEHFKDPSTVFFSFDNERVELAKSKCGILMAGFGDELSVYHKLNFRKEFFRANRLLTIGETFNNYSDFDDFILPFSDILINEPYLFKPDNKDWNTDNYIKKNFEPLMKSIFSKVRNKVNIVIGTFVNKQDEDKFPFFDGTFEPLHKLCSSFFNELLGAERFKLWILVSPQARKGRHDRYILTNYQFIDCPSGFAYFSDTGKLTSRGEAIHFYSIAHDDARKETIPSVISKFQEKVINPICQLHPNRLLTDEPVTNSRVFKFINVDKS